TRSPSRRTAPPRSPTGSASAPSTNFLGAATAWRSNRARGVAVDGRSRPRLYDAGRLGPPYPRNPEARPAASPEERAAPRRSHAARRHRRAVGGARASEDAPTSGRPRRDRAPPRADASGPGGPGVGARAAPHADLPGDRLSQPRRRGRTRRRAPPGHAHRGSRGPVEHLSADRAGASRPRDAVAADGARPPRATPRTRCPGDAP